MLAAEGGGAQRQSAWRSNAEVATEVPRAERALAGMDKMKG